MSRNELQLVVGGNGKGELVGLTYSPEERTTEAQDSSWCILAASVEGDYMEIEGRPGCGGGRFEEGDNRKKNVVDEDRLSVPKKDGWTSGWGAEYSEYWKRC